MKITTWKRSTESRENDRELQLHRKDLGWTSEGRVRTQTQVERLAVYLNKDNNH